jgi:hypothetical protein
MSVPDAPPYPPYRGSYSLLDRLDIQLSYLYSPYNGLLPITKYELFRRNTSQG